MRIPLRPLAYGVLLAVAAVPRPSNHRAEAQQSGVALWPPPSETVVRVLRDLPGGRVRRAPRSTIPNAFEFLLQPLAGTNVLVNDPAEDVPDRTTENETTLAVLGSTV